MKNNTRKKQKKSHTPSLIRLSLLSIPFPVFVTDSAGKVVPTVTLPEFDQLACASAYARCRC